MTKVINQSLQEYTLLPLKVVSLASKPFPDVILETPHKGNVSIPLKEEHYPFLFGSATQTDRHVPNIVRDIRNIEEEAKDFLLKNWVEQQDKE
jgi:hypothetical protein